jgi:CBS-domain-containing membrane protein
VMTRDVVCCPPEADIDEASRIMRDRRVRHLPVCDGDGSLLGVISIGDLNAYHASTQEAQIHFLNEYVYGRA